jgi:leucyl aminopeptidase
MTFTISFSKSQTKEADTIVIGVFEGGKLSEGAKELDKDSKGLIKANLKEHQSFEGKVGQRLSLAMKVRSSSRVRVIGLGKEKDLTTLKAETIGGKLHDSLKASSAKKIDIYLDGVGEENAEIAAHLMLGFRLKSYHFTKYKSDAKKLAPKIAKVNGILSAHAKAKKIYTELNQVADGVFLARDLVNEPPNELHPESYAKLIQKELKPLGVDVEVLNEKQMEKLGFKALLSVGQGSIRESRCVIMRWNGSGKKQTAKKRTPIALVGKGVTFDTGGISLKPGAEMDLMKMDMGGSAAVVGTMKAIAKRKAKAAVVGIVGLVENMPSDRAYRPGDIIGSLAGKTIEVLNTDAEGRLVLADALTYVQQKYKPEVVIDLATLTGAIMVALGFEYCGAFANDDKLWDQLYEASQNTGEKFWRMPLDEAYRKEMESEVADLKNLGLGRYGGACSAAGFLEHFIEDKTKWAHIDIAGTAWWKSDKATTPKGGTGFPVRALDDLIKNHYEK